jgi:hypothetical protein
MVAYKAMRFKVSLYVQKHEFIASHSSFPKQLLYTRVDSLAEAGMQIYTEVGLRA